MKSLAVRWTALAAAVASAAAVSVALMWGTVGAILPFAVGVGVSPFPIIAVVLLILSRRGKASAVAFLVVRVVSVVVTVGVFAVVSDVIETNDSASPLMAVVRIGVGVTLVVLAVRKWGGRPGVDTEPKLPDWMNAVEGSPPGKAAVLSVVLSVANPKELLLNVGAGLTIGNAVLALGPTFGVVAIYTVIACAGVAIPVVGFLVAPDRIRVPLEAARAWLVRYNAVIMSVVLLLVGVALIGGGLGDL